VTGAELTPARERVPHRNALYRNLGAWKFEDVSRQAGVDLAAWGSGACAGDFDGDGLLDLYVTNWGPNALFRNRGDGTFERWRLAPAWPPVAGARGVRSLMPTPTATGPLRRPLRSRHVGCRRASAADAPVAQRAAHHGRADRTAGESDLFFEKHRQRPFVEATAAHCSPTRPGPTARSRRHRITTTTGSSMCSSRTTRTEFPVSQPRERPLRKARD